MEDIQSATKDSPPNLNPLPCALHHITVPHRSLQSGSQSVVPGSVSSRELNSNANYQAHCPIPVLEMNSSGAKTQDLCFLFLFFVFYKALQMILMDSIV